MVRNAPRIFDLFVFAHPRRSGWLNCLRSLSQGFSTRASKRTQKQRLAISVEMVKLFPVAHQLLRIGTLSVLLMPRILSSQRLAVRARAIEDESRVVPTLSKKSIGSPLLSLLVIC